MQLTMKLTADQLKQLKRKLASQVQSHRTTDKKKGLHLHKDEALTTDWLLQQWMIQDGKCWFTGKPMTFDNGRVLTNVSMDRIDNSEGHGIYNIVLVQRAINHARNDASVYDFMCWLDSIGGLCPERQAELQMMKEYESKRNS